jgi:4-hydroxy-tetrahydrodipicolinate synthase
LNNSNQRLRGHWPAMLTPVATDGRLDTGRAIAHGQRLLDAGVDGLTLFGTTGEGTAFTVAQRMGLVDAMVAQGIAASRLIVNLTALALDDAIEIGRHAMRHGVAGTMLMPPFFFNAPRDAGLIEAVSQVVRGVASDGLNLLLYHFPSQCNVPFSHAAIAELVRRHPQQIVGVKDSSADLEHSLGLVKAFAQLSILVGCEPHVAPTMRAGGGGSVNGLANVAPRLMQRVIGHPDRVSAEDDKLMQGLLALMSARPGMPFVSVYKTMLAEQTGDDAWLNVCAPLDPLDTTEARAVRDGYRAVAGGAAIL